MWRITRLATARSLNVFRGSSGHLAQTCQSFFGGLISSPVCNDTTAAHKDHRHQSEEGRCEIADLKLPEHEGEQGLNQKQQQLLNLNGLVVVQIAKNHACHRQTNGKHHNGFDHAALVEMLGVLSRTASGEGLTVT